MTEKALEAEAEKKPSRKNSKKHLRAVAGGKARAKKEHSGSLLKTDELLNAFYFLIGSSCNAGKALKRLMPESNPHVQLPEDKKKWLQIRCDCNPFEACKVLSQRLGYSMRHIQRTIQIATKSTIDLSMPHN